MNQKVQNAFVEVRKYHPEVKQVFISKDGLWLFYDEFLNCPIFDKDVNVDCIFDMVDSIDILPAAFYYDNTKVIKN